MENDHFGLAVSGHRAIKVIIPNAQYIQNSMRLSCRIEHSESFSSSFKLITLVPKIMLQYCLFGWRFQWVGRGRTLNAFLLAIGSLNSKWTKNDYFSIETGDRLGSSWFSISRDRIENTVSLGHTYLYPRSPLITLVPKIQVAFEWRWRGVAVGHWWYLTLVLLSNKG